MTQLAGRQRVARREAAPAARLASLGRLLASRRVLLGAAGTIAMIFMWWLAIETELVNPANAAGPGQTLRETVGLLGDPTFLENLWITFQVWALSMAVAIIVAVPVGVLLGYFKRLYGACETAVHTIRSVPATALIPVSVLIFGLGVEMQMWITVFAIVWPILFNTMYGVHHTERQQLLVARHLRWSQIATLRRVVLPAAGPSIVTGIRIAAGLAMVVVISVQIIAAESGVGRLMIWYENAGLHAHVYASILITGIMGAVLYSAVAGIERRLLPWAARGREGDR